MKPEVELSLEYDKSYIKNKKLVLVYNINVFSFDKLNIDKEDFEKRLKDFHKDKYIELKSNTKKQAIYEFDPAKWLKDTISSTITDTPDRFEKKIKLGKLPSQVLNYANPIEMDQIINGTFRNYLDKNAKLKKTILNSMSCVVKPLLSYFSYRYDGYDNAIQITLKSEFRTNPMILMKADEINKPHKEIKKMGFDKTVYTILSTYNMQS